MVQCKGMLWKYAAVLPPLLTSSLITLFKWRVWSVVWRPRVFVDIASLIPFERVLDRAILAGHLTLALRHRCLLIAAGRWSFYAAAIPAIVVSQSHDVLKVQSPLTALVCLSLFPITNSGFLLARALFVFDRFCLLLSWLDIRMLGSLRGASVFYTMVSLDPNLLGD